KGEKIHLLSGVLRCPVCGAGMYGNKSIKHRKDGAKYSDYFYYGCKHRNMTRGHKCDYRKQVSETKLDGAVVEVLRKLVSNKKFAGMMREKINMEVDTSALDQEISAQEKTLRQSYLNKDAILSDLDNLDYEDKHYKRRKADLEDRLSKTYDKIEETENALVEAKAKKRSILAEKVCGDNIYKALIFFDKMYEPMNEAERREFLTQFIEKVEIYEEEQENGKWLKSIEFKLPIISKDMNISLDNGSQIETCVLLSHQKVEKWGYIDYEPQNSDYLKDCNFQATYADVTEWVMKTYGEHVSNLNIAQVKDKCGFEKRENYNKGKEGHRIPQCPPEKEKMILEAFQHDLIKKPVECSRQALEV
nr:zinc ribbon domain-containing protein [Lachnospiraceae bacterium]